MVPSDAPKSEVRRPQIVPQLDFLASATISMDKPVYIGETPEGVCLDFFALDGTLIGPKVNGRVLPRSSDHLFVRRDGIGVIRVRAMVATDDGAMLEVEYTGSVEFGPDGYARALANNLPSRAPLAICPRVLTGHPKYLWLNRLQFFGVGEALVDKLLLRYDCFFVRPASFNP
jgi:hypothetical protein